MVLEIQLGRSSSIERSHSTQVRLGRSMTSRSAENIWCGVWGTIRNLRLAFIDNVRIKVTLFRKEDWIDQRSFENLFLGCFLFARILIAKYKRFGLHKDEFAF